MQFQTAGASRRQGQAGEGRAGMIIALLVVLLIGHVIIKIVPPRIASGELSDVVGEKLQFRAAHKMTDEGFVTAVLKYANDEGLPIMEEAILLTETSAEYKCTIEYDIDLQMIWGAWPQHFKIEKAFPKFG